MGISKSRTAGTLAIADTPKELSVNFNSGNIILKNTGANIIWITTDGTIPNSDAADLNGYPLDASERIELQLLPDREWTGVISLVSVAGASTLAFLFA